MIRVAYRDRDQPPGFPASDQHPDAVRYRVGAYWVDAVGGEPTLAAVEAFLTPPPPPREFDADVVIAALKQAGKLAATETAATATPKDKDRFYWQRRASFVESNPKLARLALAAGWDVRAIFDLAQTM